MIQAADGIHLWSETYDRVLKDIFDIQEDIAKAVANELKITLGIGKSFKQLGGTENVEAYGLYLFAKGQWNEGTYATMGNSLKYIDAAIERDPKYALAWALKSVTHSFLSVLSPDNSNSAMDLDNGLKAARKAIELEPSLPAGYISLGQNMSFRGRWIEAELALNKAIGLTAEPITYIAPAIPQHYNSVGKFEGAKKLIEETMLNNPLDGPNQAWHVLCLGFLNDIKAAEEEYKSGKILFGDKYWWGDSRITIVRLGAEKSISPENITYSDPIFNAAKEHLNSPKEALAVLHKLYSDGAQSDRAALGYISISIWAAYFDDYEFALEVMDKAYSINANYIMYSWLPVMKEVRKLPQFKDFVKKIGLVDYWNEFGWPDICRSLDNGDFECD